MTYRLKKSFSPTLPSLALCVAALALGGCAHTQKEPGPELEVLTYDVEVGEQTLTGVSFKFPWEINNPTDSPARLQAINWTLSVDGEPEKKGTDTPGTQIPAGGKASDVLQIDLPMSTSTEAFEARDAKGGLDYFMLARFSVKEGDQSADYEATWRGDIFPPKHPTVAVQAHAMRYGAAGDLTFTIVITNPNPFDVRASQLTYVIRTGEQELASGTVAQDRKLYAGTETQFDVTRQIDRKNLPELAAQLPKLKTLDYAVDTSLKIDDLVFPQKIAGQINFPD